MGMASSLVGKRFWIPHMADFRGRLYPYSGTLSYLQSDEVRSSVCFNIFSGAIRGLRCGSKKIFVYKVFIIYDVCYITV